MSEPIKPRIDFDQPLAVEPEMVLKASQQFAPQDAENFLP
ncbi:MAG: TIGR01620 family protein, partial [Enterobacterales bacterium]|nr:TIGR01620 family protein [Enterobacterales bacterium]